MAYEIVMPQLSDSMEEGKLISWKVHEGDTVHKGDTIAEVESDKAIMEVQSFRDGTVGKLLVHEGDTVPVGTVIARIETGAVEAKLKEKEAPQQQAEPPASSPQPEKAETTPASTPKPETEAPHPAPSASKPLESPKPKTQTPAHSILDEILGLDENQHTPPAPKVEGTASPKAKALAAKYGIDIEKLQHEEKLPVPAHEADIEKFRLTHYFTPKALKLLELYRLDPSLFGETKKHSSDDILAYVREHDIPLPKPVTPFQKALIATVENAAKKPTYRLYDHIDITELLKHKKYSLTVSLIRLFAKAMMDHEAFRSVYKEDAIITYPNASISLAVAHGEYLYMPVFRDANLMNTEAIHKQLEAFEEKAQKGTMSAADMEGSTFGISNLGMLGVERFDAMINKDDSAIAAIGTAVENRLRVTLTLDHRLINGYQAALFMQTLKELALDPNTWKESS